MTFTRWAVSGLTCVGLGVLIGLIAAFDHWRHL